MRKRPLLCAACMCMLGAWCGIAEEKSGIRLFLLPAALILFLFPYVLSGEWRKLGIAGGTLILAFVFFFFHAGAEVQFRASYETSLSDGAPVTVRGTLYKKEIKNEQVLYYLTGCKTAFSNGSIRTNDVAAYLNPKSDQYSIGQILTIDAKLNTWKPAANEGGFDAEAYYLSQKIDFSIRSCRIRAVSGRKCRYREWLLSVRSRMGAVYDRYLEENDAGVLKAMILGDKTELGNEIRTLYQKSGISHMLAISGLHISLIGMSFYRLIRRLGMGFLKAGLLAGGVVVSYAWMSGFSVSSKRACGMFLLMVFATAVKRSYDMLTAMGILLAALLWQNPFLFGYSGFVFSFAAVAGVGIAGRVLSAGKKRLAQTFWMSAGIQLMTLPLVAAYYYEIPVYAVFINLLLLPFLSAVVFSGICGGISGLFVNGAWVRLFFLPADWILGAYEAVCAKALLLPGAQYICGKPSVLQIVLYYVLFVIFLRMTSAKKKKETERKTSSGKNDFRAWKIALLLFVLCYRGKEGFEMDVLDVGQGDGIYVRTGDCTSCFFDGGSTDVKEVGTRRLLPFLKYNGVKKITCWFVSHGDNDHISGLLEVLESGYPVEYLIVSAYMPQDEAYKKLIQAAEKNKTTVTRLKAGDVIRLSDAQFACVFPTKSYAKSRGEDRNACSLAVRYEEAGVSAFLAGDLDTEGEQAMLKEVKTAETDFFKVNHHGSAGSNSKELLEALSPELAVISCAKKNNYGHPAKEAISRLTEAGCDIFYTMESGQVRVILTERELSAASWRE